MLLLNPILLVSGQTIDSDVIYLNKVAECTFEVGYRIDIEDNIAYVTDNDGAIVIDIENPKKPKKIGRIPMDDSAFGIEVRNDTAFVVGGNPTLVIANVSNPHEPVIIGQYQGSYVGYTVATKGNYCYLGMWETDTAIINITDLTNPTFVKEISGTRSEDAVVHEDLLFVSTYYSEFKIFNISDPVNPVLLRTLITPGGNGIVIQEDTAFLACHGNGVSAVSIATPASAYVLKTISQDDEGEAQGIDITGNFCVVADNYGVEVYNVTEPTYMAKEAEYRRGVSAAHDVATAGNFLFVAKGFGLGIYEISATKKGYFPPYLYWVLPIVVVVMGGLSILITLRRKERLA
ncbi:MAG: LVIVD repeat-containing protein [Candidatus Heimdallarchaeota archaeon]